MGKLESVELKDAAAGRHGQLAIHHCAVPGVDKVGHARRRCAFVNFDLRLTDPKRIQPGLIRPQWFNDPTKEARIVQQLLRTWQSLVPHLPHPGGNIDPSG